MIFTESLTTQDYLRELLLESRLLGAEQITIFRGDNVSPRAAQAHARWEAEVGQALAAHSRPTRDVAIRLALVHEFATRSSVFISTEAGAKGLNLQFCETLVNYDLPWNPQRIEQRIGRCHRYGQLHDVTVINFLASDNETQRLTFEILSQKLDLFGTVLGASDQVLHLPGTDAPETVAGAFSAEFESRLRRIYERARTVAEIEAELRQLRDNLGQRRAEFDAAHRRTAHVIQTHFDDSVQRVFREIKRQLPSGLAELDRDLLRVLDAYFEATGLVAERIHHREHLEIRVPASTALPPPLQAGLTVTIGHAAKSAASALDEVVHPGHPLIRAALEEARAATQQPFRVRVEARSEDPELVALIGRAGRLLLAKVCFEGFEPSEVLLPVVLLEGDAGPLQGELAQRLLACRVLDAEFARPAVSDADMDDALEEALLHVQRSIASKEQRHFERAMSQLERFIADRQLLLRRRRELLAARLTAAQAATDAAVGADNRTLAEQAARKLAVELEELEQQSAALDARQDAAYQRYRQRAHERRYARPQLHMLLTAELRVE